MATGHSMRVVKIAIALSILSAFYISFRLHTSYHVPPNFSSKDTKNVAFLRELKTSSTPTQLEYNTVENYYKSEIKNLQDLSTNNTEFEPSGDLGFKSPYIITSYHTGKGYNYTTRTTSGTRRKKIISFYMTNVSDWFIQEETHHRDFKACPYSECEVDIKGKKIDSADLLLFICNDFQTPPRRPSGQMWAIGCWESAPHWTFSNYSLWKDAFNLTLSYRLDADVFAPFVKLKWREPSTLLKEEDYVTIAKQKTRTAAWWVSNCRRDRMRFVWKMARYIDIDVFGKCGQMKCPRTNDVICKEILNATYKFYFAFENSVCKDYVTEKFHKIFDERLHVIPVVRGGADYDKYFPPNTFVNGNNFNTAKDLAAYLEELGNDVSRYAKMLQAKDKLKSAGSWYLDWCDVCKILHRRTEKSTRIYKDIWYWSHHSTCIETGYSHHHFSTHHQG